jgi:hypothetical protein
MTAVFIFVSATRGDRIVTIYSTIDRKIQHFAALPVNPRRACQFIATEKRHYDEADKCGEAPVVGKPYCRTHCAMAYDLVDPATVSAMANLLRLSRLTGRSLADHLLALMEGETMRSTALPSGETPRKSGAQ